MELGALLNRLNKEYLHLHTTNEDIFWEAYMGDASMNPAMDKAKNELEAWRSNAALIEELQSAIATSTDEKLIQR
jgi:hypothetical protein